MGEQTQPWPGPQNQKWGCRFGPTELRSGREGCRDWMAPLTSFHKKDNMQSKELDQGYLTPEQTLATLNRSSQRETSKTLMR